MKFELIGNACGIFHGDNGTRILCDPWIENGVFEGSWYHYPPLKTHIEDVLDVDALYVSHLHPDHFDARTFNFRLDIPILILDDGPNFLSKILKRMGYRHIIPIKNDETVEFKEFEITMYAPFSKHVFHEAKIGNIIDSAMVVKNNDHIAINFNDNTPTVDACIELKKKFGAIDLAMINYNAAGPYPACFYNLSEDEKYTKHREILLRNYEHMVSVSEALSPSYVLPFAGAYVLAGKQSVKNKYLGTSTWDECADYISPKLAQNISVICLRENDVFDLTNGQSDKAYIPIDQGHLERYIASEIADVKYPFESDEEPDRQKLVQDARLASERMVQRMTKIGITLETCIFLNIDEDVLQIHRPSKPNTSLTCTMDLRLLRRILDKQSHWNNAEIGCHIEFFREPNNYDPDLHTALQFFHC